MRPICVVCMFAALLAIVTVLLIARMAYADLLRGEPYTMRGMACTEHEAMRQVLIAGAESGRPAMAMLLGRFQNLRAADGRPLCALAQGQVVPVRTHESADVAGMGRLYITECATSLGTVFIFRRDRVVEPGDGESI